MFFYTDLPTIFSVLTNLFLQEVVYHGTAFILYLAASLTFVIEVNHRKRNYGYDYEPYFAASVIIYVKYYRKNCI